MSRASATTQEVASDAARLGAFAYDAPQYRVVFGSGTVAQLGDEAYTTGVVIGMSAEARIPHVPLLPRRAGESTIVKMDATH